MAIEEALQQSLQSQPVNICMAVSRIISQLQTTGVKNRASETTVWSGFAKNKELEKADALRKEIKENFSESIGHQGEFLIGQLK